MQLSLLLSLWKSTVCCLGRIQFSVSLIKRFVFDAILITLYLKLDLSIMICVLIDDTTFVLLWNGRWSLRNSKASFHIAIRTFWCLWYLRSLVLHEQLLNIKYNSKLFSTTLKVKNLLETKLFSFQNTAEALRLQ